MVVALGDTGIGVRVARSNFVRSWDGVVPESDRFLQVRR
jgi:hypothetical protein